MDQQQRVHLSDIEDDPIQIWRKLEEVHMNKQAGTRFNAYDDLFSIRLQESESLSSLITRVDAVMNKIQGLRPSDFDIKQMDEELAIMALIRALPQDQYGSFISSLLLQKDLKKDTVQSAFKNEETNRKPRSSPGVSGDSALRAFSSSPSSSKPKVKCDFCDRTNHSTSECRGLQAYKKKKAESQSQKQVPSPSPSTTPQANSVSISSNSKTEYAGNASFPSSSPSEPISDHWLVDSGATSHMTPNRHWFHTLVSHRVPVRLANGLVIYSEGKGTVLFIPRGNNGPTVHISDVLFVPELGCNLFSPLHLTQHRGFTVTIIKDLISFTKDSVTHFYAKVCNSNIAILDGTVQVQQIATVSQELVDRSLLHRRLGHISKGRLEQLLRNKLVVNLKLGSDTPMSDLCEACILGKQHRSPFPQQAENRHSNPLDLIHSDVHGPLPT